MSRKTVAFLVILFISPIIIYFLWPSDEGRIRKLFSQGAKAVEAKKIDDVMAKVSYSYSDEHGLTYIVLKDGFGRVFREVSNIKVEYEITAIEVREEKATAEAEVRMIASRGADAGYVAGDAAKPLHMKFFLEKEHTKWLIVRTEGLPAGF